jgi:hypothetical protein
VSTSENQKTVRSTAISATIDRKMKPRGPRMSIDWAKGKALHYQGVTSAEIANVLGCSRSAVTSRMKRERWSQEKARLQSDLRSVAISRATDTVKCTAEAFVDEMIGDIQETLVALRECPPRPNLDLLMSRENVLEKFNKRARLTFGLDSETKTTVQIAFFSNGPKPELQAIDVQEVKPVDPPVSEV